MAAPNLQRTLSIEQRDVFRKHDDNVFKPKPQIVETGPLDDALLKRKRQFQKKQEEQKKQKTFKSTFEHIEPADMLKNRRPGITRRGGKRKRRKTRKRRKKPKTRRRKKIRKKRKRRKTRKRKRKRRGGVAAGFLGEESCGEVKLNPMYQDCCELEKAELRGRFLAVERQRRRQQQRRARQRRGGKSSG